MWRYIALLLLAGCTFAHVPPGCIVERISIVSCTEKAKGESKLIVIPMN